MPAAEDALGLVKLRFATGESPIERLFRLDGSFRMLCQDYADCVDALERLQKEDSAVGLARRAEYTELLEDLEGEIRDWLRRQDVSPRPL